MVALSQNNIYFELFDKYFVNIERLRNVEFDLTN